MPPNQLPSINQLNNPQPPVGQIPVQPTQTVPTNNPQPLPPVEQQSIKKLNPNSTQNSLQFAEIRDGFMIMNDGSFRAIVMVKSINFDLMSSAEQEAVEYSYQGFLNSLYFNIQILMQSRKIDMGTYINNLDNIRSKQDNMLLALLMDDYLDFIDELTTATNIMNKRFYVVIPYSKTENLKSSVKQNSGVMKGFFGGNKSTNRIVIDKLDLEDAKIELKNRIGLVVNGLVGMGIQSIPLNTKEIIELFYNSYNPDIAPREPFNGFDNVNPSLTITRGGGRAVQPNLDGVK